MSRAFILVAIICFLLAFLGASLGWNGGKIAGPLSWNDLVALGLFFGYSSSLV